MKWALARFAVSFVSSLAISWAAWHNAHWSVAITVTVATIRFSLQDLIEDLTEIRKSL